MAMTPASVTPQHPETSTLLNSRHAYAKAERVLSLEFVHETSRERKDRQRRVTCKSTSSPVKTEAGVLEELALPPPMPLMDRWRRC